MPTKDLSRRKFLSASALAFSGIALGSVTAFGARVPAANKVRVGIIGVGNRGNGLLHSLKQLEGIEILACCDIREGTLAMALNAAGSRAKGYTDYRKMLEDKNIDAVIIATPLYQHYQMAVAAIEANKHVYVEKTMTYDIPQALSLVKKVNNSKLVFQVGHQYRYFGLYYKLKQVLDENWLGKVTHFECQYHRNSSWRNKVTDPSLEKLINWRMYKEYSGGLMAELCAHQIDVVNWMLDSHPLKVAGLGGINYWNDGRETYDNVRAVFEYPKGIKVSTSSILSNAYNGYMIKILGDKATLEVQRDTIVIYGETEKKELGIVDGVTGATIANRTQGAGQPVPFDNIDGAKRTPTQYSLMSFADCIRTGKKPSSNVETGKNAAIAVHLANEAMEKETTQYWKPEFSS
jgi:predicted dehydrogenase